MKTSLRKNEIAGCFAIMIFQYQCLVVVIAIKNCDLIPSQPYLYVISSIKNPNIKQLHKQVKLKDLQTPHFLLQFLGKISQKNRILCISAIVVHC